MIKFPSLRLVDGYLKNCSEISIKVGKINGVVNNDNGRTFILYNIYYVEII